MVEAETRHLPSRSELTEKCKAMTMPEAIQRGKELREKGFRLVPHGVWADSVAIPNGEAFSEERLNVRYRMVDNKEELEEAFEYLVLCETALKKTNDVDRGYRLGP